jgi:hypothetical protein
MESKKINQLATELTPALSDLTIIGDPTTGISKKITLSQMASLFTGTVEEYPSLASFPLVGVADTIYIATDTNILYRWDTSLNAYAELSPNIVTSLVFSDANGFDGTISLVGSVATLTITTALTQGSVPFIGTSGALTQDNANLFFDDTNNRLGINTNSPTTALDVFGSGIIGRINGTSTNNAFLGFASAGSNKWSIGNVQSDHRFRIYNEATTSELVSVLQTGEFGIGIANPTTKLHIDGGASALIANLDANVSVAKSISFRSDNSARINLEVSGTESGSNAGGNFFIRRYSDAGSLIDTPLTITRSTGAISLATALSGTTASFTTRISINENTPVGLLHISALDATGATNLQTAYDNSRFRINVQQGSSVGISMGYAGSNLSYIQTCYSSNQASPLLINPFGGNVGIGTTTMGAKLDVQASGVSTFSYYFRNGLGGYGGGVYNTGANNTSIYLANSSGTETVLIGSSGGSFFNGGNVSIGTNNGTGRLMLYSTGNVFQNIASPSGGSTQVGINFSPSMTDGEVASNPAQASIYATDSNYGANIIFANKSVGAVGNSLTERMRISSGGQIGINTTVIQNSSVLNLYRPPVGSNFVPQLTFQGLGNYPNMQIGTYDQYDGYIGTIGSDIRILAGISNTTENRNIMFYTTFNGASGGAQNYERLRIRYDGLIIAKGIYDYAYSSTSNVLVQSDGVLGRNTSSLKYKHNIEDYHRGLEDVLKLRPVLYESKNPVEAGLKFTGFIAEEIDEIGLTEFVQYAPDGTPDALQYPHFVALLAKAIQEQQAQIEKLKALINK